MGDPTLLAKTRDRPLGEGNRVASAMVAGSSEDILHNVAHMNDAVMSTIHGWAGSVSHLVPPEVITAVEDSHMDEILFDEWVLLLVLWAPLVTLAISCCCGRPMRRAPISPIGGGKGAPPQSAYKVPGGTVSSYPLTPQQAAAAQSALRAQTAVAKAAAAASSEDKTREDARWPRNGGRPLQSLNPS